MIDRLISRLPSPLFRLCVRLFMPRLWRLLSACNASKQGDRTLLSWSGIGHIVVTDDRIEVLE